MAARPKPKPPTKPTKAKTSLKSETATVKPRSKSRFNKGGKTAETSRSDYLGIPDKPSDMKKKQSTFSSNADVSYDATTVVSGSYPQASDLYLYGIKFFPTGTLTGVNTIARDEFVNSYGLKMLADIRNALSYGSTTPLTVTHIADYINTVANAYYTMLSIRNHFGLCYSNARRASLRTRFELIYDESIQPEYSKLVSSLAAHFLPSGVARMCEFLATPSLTAPTTGAAYIECVPYPGSLDLPSDFASMIGVELSSLAGITNAAIINTALSSSRYSSSSVNFVPLSPNKPDKFDFFFSGFATPQFSDEMVDLWINLPLEANDGVPAVIRNAVATETTTMFRHYVGNSISIVTNAFTPRLLTSTGLYEPGFLQPYMTTAVGAWANNFRRVTAAGNDSELNVSGANATAIGVLSRNAENAYSTTLAMSIAPAGTNFIRTNFQRVRNDVAEVMGILVS